MTGPRAAARVRWQGLYGGEQEAVRALVVFGMVAAAGVVVTVVLAWGTASIVLAGLQVVFAALAFLAAAGAFWATWPQYRAFAAKPKIRLWVEIAEDRHAAAERVGATATFGRDAFIVRVAIANDGEGTMRHASVNILVPALCELEAIDPDQKTHYLSPLPTWDPKVSRDGKTPVLARWTVAREDITPGDHVFHAEVRPLKTPGPWVVFVELSGDPRPPESQRSRRVVVSRRRSETEEARHDDEET